MLQLAERCSRLGDDAPLHVEEGADEETAAARAIKMDLFTRHGYTHPVLPESKSLEVCPGARRLPRQFLRPSLTQTRPQPPVTASAGRVHRRKQSTV